MVPDQPPPGLRRPATHRRRTGGRARNSPRGAPGCPWHRGGQESPEPCPHPQGPATSPTAGCHPAPVDRPGNPRAPCRRCWAIPWTTAAAPPPATAAPTTAARAVPPVSTVAPDATKAATTPAMPVASVRPLPDVGIRNHRLVVRLWIGRLLADVDIQVFAADQRVPAEQAHLRTVPAGAREIADRRLQRLFGRQGTDDLQVRLLRVRAHHRLACRYGFRIRPVNSRGHRTTGANGASRSERVRTPIDPPAPIAGRWRARWWRSG